jgi:hypothetical protein
MDELRTCSRHAPDGSRAAALEHVRVHSRLGTVAPRSHAAATCVRQ